MPRSYDRLIDRFLAKLEKWNGGPLDGDLAAKAMADFDDAFAQSERGWYGDLRREYRSDLKQSDKPARYEKRLEIFQSKLAKWKGEALTEDELASANADFAEAWEDRGKGWWRDLRKEWKPLLKDTDDGEDGGVDPGRGRPDRAAERKSSPASPDEEPLSDDPALHHHSCGCAACCGFREEPAEADDAGDSEGAATGETAAAAGTLSDMAEFLLTGYWNTGYGDGTRSHNVTGSGIDANNGALHYNLAGYSVDADGLTAARANLVRESFKLIEATLGIQFVETTSTDANLVDFFFRDNDSGAYASHGYYNSGAWGSTIHYAQINIAQGWSGGTSSYDDYTLQTILHEIGHAMGLGHQGPYNGGATYGVDNTFDNDNWQSSMMSYFSQSENTSVNASYEFLQTPMAVDWLALDAIYGRQGYGVSNAFTEDTVWGFGTTITSEVSDIWASWSNWANRTASNIVDGGGIDTLDLSGYSNNTVINLAPSDPGASQPSTSNIGGRIGNLTISAGTIIENAVGGSGGETFYGNVADNSLTGNGGDDTFFDSAGSDTYLGGAGTDYAIFSGTFLSYEFSLSGSFLQVIGAAVDWVESTVEWLTFSGNDTRSWQSIVDTVVGNVAPVAADDQATTSEDAAAVLAVLGNDADPDGDALTLGVVGPAANGSVVDNGDGTLTYTPDADFNGSDSFTYVVLDGNGGSDTATVSVTVTAVNDAPVAIDDGAVTDEDVAVTVNVLADDVDVDGDALIIASVGPAANGTVVDNGDGTLTYTPNLGWFGLDAFDYTVSDGAGGVSTATVSITVLEANEIPMAQDDEATTLEDAAVVISVLANDTDANGDSLRLDAVGAAANGTVVDNGDGTVTYTPDADFNGSDSFAYVVSDGRGGVGTATVSVAIAAVNDAPVAVDDQAATAENAAVSIAVLDNDADVDGGAPSVATIDGVAAAVDTPVALASGALATLRADGTLDYDPNGAFDGLEDGQSGVDAFVYTVDDGVGGVDAATVFVTIDGVSPPISSEAVAIDFEGEAPGAYSGDHGLVFSGLAVQNSSAISGARVGAAGSDGGFSITAGGEDFDLDALSVISSAGRQKILVEAFDDGALVGSVQLNASARRPSNATFDATFDSVDEVVFSAGGNYLVDDIRLTTYTPIDPLANLAPIAVDDALITGEAVTVSGNVLSNDSDSNGDPLTVSTIEGAAVDASGTTVTLASGALVTIDATGAVLYDPNGAFDAFYDGQQATDTFVYEVSDDRGGSAEAAVAVTIEGSGTPPAMTTVGFETAAQSNATTLVEDGFVFSGAALTSVDPGVASGSFAAESFGAAITITNATGGAFDFEAGVFTIEGRGKKTLVIEGYVDGGLIGSDSYSVRTGRETSISLDDAIFDRVDEVRVRSDSGVIVDDLLFLA